MFDRLEDIVRHYEELMLELNNPSVAEDQRTIPEADEGAGRPGAAG